MYDSLWALAERQYGVLLRDQLVPILGERRLDRWLAAARLETRGTGVYRIPGAPRTPEQELLIAVRSSGADLVAANARSSGWLWGLVDGPPSEPEVMVRASGYRRLPGVRLVESLDLTPDVIVDRRGIPTLNPLLTMLELARVLDADQLADALERGFPSLFSLAAMWATLDRYGRPGRNGIVALRNVVADRALAEKPSDAEVEERCAKVFRQFGITGWTFHHQIRDRRGRLVAEPDYVCIPLRLGVELDGAAKFRERGYLERFFERRHRMRAQQWDVEHFAWGHVVRRPEYFAATLDRLAADRARALGLPWPLPPL